MTPQQFVDKWRRMALKERSASQSHFNDLCALLAVPTPTDADQTGDEYTFERGVAKAGGGDGWADVWKRGCFGWEYKGPKKDLGAAYEQLQLYREALDNPPLLIVCDLTTIVIHTNFTNSVKRVETFDLDRLLRPAALDLLRCAWTEPERFRAKETVEAVTTRAAAQFAKLADQLRERDVEPQRAAHFLIRLLFCLFAEDIGLLPPKLFTSMVKSRVSQREASEFNAQVRSLFVAMAEGGFFGLEKVPHINGHLFDGDDVVDLDHDGLWALSQVCDFDWSSIEPAILGTLFERSLDPSKRAQLGAHYTSRDDILLIVEPVLMAPLRRRWAEVRTEAERLVAGAGDGGSDTAMPDPVAARNLLIDFGQEIAAVRVLDPACGSGNFLYVSLRQLLDLWKEVWTFGASLHLDPPLPPPTIETAPSPVQLRGIEINEYAAELAQVTIWIGYIQWLRENGFGRPPEPVLRPIESIERRDAILAFDDEGRPVEPEWPAAEVIVGNPPFLGTKLMRGALGDEYVDQLFRLYDGVVSREADLVTYWFERARAMIAAHRLNRAGLLATNSIRGGANRRVLEAIKATGDIFMAWSDRPWVLDGAAVRVSIVGFNDGTESPRTLNGLTVADIHADLTSGGSDLTKAARLPENAGLAFMGDTKGGAFDIDAATAAAMLEARGNPNSRPNSDVVRPWVNGFDLTRRRRGMWIIDFGVEMSEAEAAGYEAPFEHVRQMVKPERDQNRRDAYRERWWLHVEPRPALRAGITGRKRFICTPRVSSHRVFVWLSPPTLPDSATIAIARDDDYFFGVLLSRAHELWSLRMGTWLGVGNDPRYTPTTTFETFPFPWPPGHEPADDPRVAAIADAARALVLQRDRWLNPEGASEAELKKRTLTNLYNARPTWLDLAHRRLDDAVLDAYGWARDIGDEELLERLLALNLERAVGGSTIDAPDPPRR